MTVTINGTTGYSGPVGTIGDLTTTGNTTLGDASSDTLTLNGNTASIPNNLNFTNGNIGVGVTPSAWGSGYKALDIQYLGISNTGAGTVDCSFTQNGYYNGTNWIAKYTSPSKRYSISDSGFIWYNGASATAGAAITFTQAMTLDASGNLGIGNTAPLTKLVVGAAQTLPDSSTNVQLSGSVELCQSAAASYRAQFEVDSSAMYIGSNTYYSGGWQVYDSGRAPAQLQMVSTNLNSYISFFTSAANSGNGTERARITSGGQLLVGTTTTSGGEVARFESASTTSIGIIGSTSGACYLNFGDTSDANVGFIGYDHTNNFMNFRTNGSERARITSDGNLLVKATSTEARGVTLYGSGNNGFYIRTTGTCGYLITQDGTGGSGTLLTLYSNNTSVGSITTNGTTTTYGTSSDYRLKENISPMTGALAKVAALNPCTYTWKVDGSEGQGFIAHELQAVVPDAVVGGKDAVDADGNPVYQNIDTSFLVATLTAAIQEQQAIIEQLQADFSAYKQTHP